MNKKESSAKNGVKTFETSDDFLTFKITHFREDWDQLNEWGDPAVIDVEKEFPAHIVHPDSGRIMQGFLVPWGPYEHNGHSYAILDQWAKPDYLAVRIEPQLGLENGGFYQMRPVVLHNPVRNDWDVFRYDEGSWQLIPGQHLMSRTANAQQWLDELETKIIPNLDLQAAELFNQRVEAQASRQAINPTSEERLRPVTATSNARIEWLGPDYKKYHHARQVAERRCANVDVALRRHSVSTPEIAPVWSAIGRWLSHARMGKRLHIHAQKAQACHQRLAHKCLAFETSVIPEEGQTWIKERAEEMLKIDSEMRKTLKFVSSEKEALAIQMSEAAKLTRLLKQQSPDTLVTMDQSQVPERRVQTVPVLREENASKLKMTSSNRMRP